MKERCSEFRDDIPRAVLGDISPEEHESLLLHLGECPPCAEEQALYAATLQHLQTLDDAPVPRHFFVYPEERRVSPWTLFRQLHLAWRAALVFGALATILLAVLAAANLQIRVDSGVLAVSFGRTLEPRLPAAPPAGTVEALQAGLVQVLEARLHQERQEWMQILKGELARLSISLTQSQQNMLQAGLVDMEAGVNQRILTTQAAMLTGTDESLNRLYQLLREERQADLQVVSDRLDQMMQRGELKSSQTDTILMALVDVVDLGIRK